LLDGKHILHVLVFVFFSQAQLLGEQIKDSNNKMQSLLMMTPEIVTEIIKIYNTGVTTNSQPPTPAPSTGLFGGANTGAASNPFSMAGTAAQPTVASIFGGGAAQSMSGGFGGAVPAASIFGQSTQATAFGQPAKPSIFGQSNTSFGGGQQQTSSIFGSTAPQTQTFGGAPAFSQTGVSGGSIFGGGAAQPAQPGSIFGAAPAQTPFGGGNTSIFGGSAQPQNTGSIFAPAPAAQTNQFAAQPMGGSIFGNAPQTTGFQAMQQAQPVPAYGSSMFTAAPTVQPTFQSSTNMPQNNSAPPYPGGGGGSLFGNTQPAQSQQQPPPPIDASIYSKMENLTKEQIDAFQAGEFVLGQIPTVPPPREMCL
jgi:nucleoporin-like protein 2